MKDTRYTRETAIDKVENTFNNADANADAHDDDDDDDDELDFAEVGLMDRDPTIWTSSETMALLKLLCLQENCFRLNNPSLVTGGRAKDVHQRIVVFT